MKEGIANKIWKKPVVKESMKVCLSREQKLCHQSGSLVIICLLLV